MERAARNEEQPGTKTNDPVEGKPTDARDEGGPVRTPERPGTKTAARRGRGRRERGAGATSGRQ